MTCTNLDLLKVDLRWQVGAIGLAANIFYVQIQQTIPHPIPDLDVIVDMGQWMTDTMAPMAPHVVVSCDITGANVYQKVGPLWNLLGPALVIFDPQSIGDPLPSGVAGLMVVYTATSKVMGKKYLVGMSELAQTAGLWIGAVMAAMLQSALLWLEPFLSIADPTTVYVPGVWSAKLSGFARFAASVSTRDVPAYQRRRKAGVGT